MLNVIESIVLASWTNQLKINAMIPGLESIQLNPITFVFCN